MNIEQGNNTRNPYPKVSLPKEIPGDKRQQHRRGFGDYHKCNTSAPEIPKSIDDGEHGKQEKRT